MGNRAFISLRSFRNLIRDYISGVINVITIINMNKNLRSGNITTKIKACGEPAKPPLWRNSKIKLLY